MEKTINEVPRFYKLWIMTDRYKYTYYWGSELSLIEAVRPLYPEAHWEEATEEEVGESEYIKCTNYENQ